MAYEQLEGMGQFRIPRVGSMMARVTKKAIKKAKETAKEEAKKKAPAARAIRTVVARDPTGGKSHIEKFKSMPLEEQVKVLAEIYAFKTHINAKPYEKASPEAAAIAFEKLPDVIFIRLKSVSSGHPRWILSPSRKGSTYYKDLYELLPVEKKVELLTHLRDSGNTKIFDYFAPFDPAATGMVSPLIQKEEVSQEVVDSQSSVVPEEKPGMPVWGWVAMGVGGVALLSLLGWVSFR